LRHLTHRRFKTSVSLLLVSLPILLVILVAPGMAFAKQDDKQVVNQLDQLYHEALLEFQRKNYHTALPLLEKYISLAKSRQHKRNRVVWVIDHIGRIKLTIKHNPDEAILFFRSIVNDSALNEEEIADVEGWLAAAIDWKKLGKLPDEVKTAEGLYAHGNQYYQKAISKLKYPMDNAGNADFHIAASYLIPFIVNFDKDEKIGETLYMMGDIRRHVRTDKLYWSENFYIKEVIRRFPNTRLAQKAWEILNDDIHFAYTGSRGDSTPPEQIRMLQRYRRMAEPAKPQIPGRNQDP